MQRQLAAVTTFVAAMSLAVLPATAAAAADDDVITPGWRWLDVVDNGYQLQDAESFYEDFLGSGVELDGWRDDAFDNLMRVTAFDPDAGDGGEFVDTYPIVRFGGDELGPLPITPVSASWLDNGRTTTVGTTVADFGDGRVVTVTFTLEIENSTARWTIARDVVGGDPGVVEVVIGGDLGSDSDSTYVDLGGGAWISHDTNRGDPVIAWRFTDVSPTMGLPVNVGGVEFSMTGAGTSTVTVGVIDFDECSFVDAIDTMTALAPGLSLGQTIAPIYATDCLLADDPAPVAHGDPVVAFLPLTPTAPLISDNWAPSSVDNFTSRGWRVDAVDAPAGLVAVLEWVPDTSSLAIRLSGTPTEGWSGPATFVVHRGQEPVLVQVDLEIEAAPQLAATGSADLTISAVVAALSVLAGVAIALGTRRRIASAR